jgi:hypothetical protein
MAIQTVIVPRNAATVSVIRRGLTGPQGPAGEGATPAWGDITGTLDDQTDLQTALNAKAAAAFVTIVVSGQSDVVADGVSDTLTLVAGTNITLTTNATTDTITIAGPSLTGYLQKGADGSGSNSAGSNTTISPGVSTGNATPASLILQSTQAGASGSSAQTLYNTLVVTNGYVAIRQPGGTGGTDELRISDDGAVCRFTRPTDAAGDGFAWNLIGSDIMALRRNFGFVMRGGWPMGQGSGDPVSGTPDVATIRSAAREWTDYDGSNQANLADRKFRNYLTDTTTGSKIGTSTSQKFGFWNATPVVQQVLATGAGASVDNVISLLQTLGLCRQTA